MSEKPWVSLTSLEVVEHVVPLDDLIEHDAVGFRCLCGPDAGDRDGTVVVVHHSLDGREQDDEPDGEE